MANKELFNQPLNTTITDQKRIAFGSPSQDGCENIEYLDFKEQIKDYVISNIETGLVLKTNVTLSITDNVTEYEAETDQDVIEWYDDGVLQSLEAGSALPFTFSYKPEAPDSFFVLVYIDTAALALGIQVKESEVSENPQQPAAVDAELALTYILVNSTGANPQPAVGEKLIYLGLHGNDANDGLTIGAAVRELDEAITKSIANVFKTIVCFDDGVYLISNQLSSGTILFMPNASIVFDDEYIINENCSITCKSISGNSGAELLITDSDCTLNVNTINVLTTIQTDAVVNLKGCKRIENTLTIGGTDEAPNELYCDTLSCVSFVRSSLYNDIYGIINGFQYPDKNIFVTIGPSAGRFATIEAAIASGFYKFYIIENITLTQNINASKNNDYAFLFLNRSIYIDFAGYTFTENTSESTVFANNLVTITGGTIKYRHTVDNTTFRFSNSGGTGYIKFEDCNIICTSTYAGSALYNIGNACAISIITMSNCVVGTLPNIAGSLFKLNIGTVINSIITGGGSSCNILASGVTSYVHYENNQFAGTFSQITGQQATRFIDNFGDATAILVISASEYNLIVSNRLKNVTLQINNSSGYLQNTIDGNIFKTLSNSLTSKSGQFTNITSTSFVAMGGTVTLNYLDIIFSDCYFSHDLIVASTSKVHLIGCEGAAVTLNGTYSKIDGGVFSGALTSNANDCIIVNVSECASITVNPANVRNTLANNHLVSGAVGDDLVQGKIYMNNGAYFEAGIDGSSNKYVSLTIP